MHSLWCKFYWHMDVRAFSGYGALDPYLQAEQVKSFGEIVTAVS